MEINRLAHSLLSRCERDLLSQTRIHPIDSAGKHNVNIFLKREDESGFSSSGCKKRKYASLLPWLKSEKYERVVAIGGPFSNHIPSLVQLLRERNIRSHLVLKASHQTTLRGNALLIRLLTPDDQIDWISAAKWKEAEVLAQEIAQSRNAYVVPEGAFCEGALPGACTLMLDIMRNESETGLHFDHIFTDSGSGMTAGALALMNEILGRSTQIHIVLTAGDESFFREQGDRLANWMTPFVPSRVSFPTNIRLHPPVTARSFGSVNATVLKETIRLARESGILADPVYTTKLLMTARAVIETRNLKGNVLIIHGGGGTGLMGFGEKLEHLLLSGDE